MQQRSQAGVEPSTLQVYGMQFNPRAYECPQTKSVTMQLILMDLILCTEQN